MCGIVGFVSGEEKDLERELIDQLEKLEYRGYDSAGLAFVNKRSLFQVEKARGGLDKLRKRLPPSLCSKFALGHTRWATHGVPSETNALPILSGDGSFVLAFNGIVENDHVLRKHLKERGYHFQTENDAETLLALIISCYEDTLEQAVAAATKKVEGRYSFVVASLHDPSRLVISRRGLPLILGRGEGFHFVASDLAAFPSMVNSIAYVEDDQVVSVLPDQVLAVVDQLPCALDWTAHVPMTPASFEQTSMETHTLCEMLTQPESLALGIQRAQQDLSSTTSFIEGTEHVVFIGCGSAYHAALIGELAFERLTQTPARAYVASDFRDRGVRTSPETLVVLLSQSGETADTLACLEQVKKFGSKTLAICNAERSSLARLCDYVLPLHCGPEIGVASTKAYTGMLVQILFLAMAAARTEGNITPDDIENFSNLAASLPEAVSEILSRRQVFQQLARALRERRSFLFVGRGAMLPTALEGGLKLRELSYRHAVGIGAGELKHGTLAVIEPRYPVFVLLDDHSKKMVNTIRELKVRGAYVVGVGPSDDSGASEHCDQFFPLPDLGLFQPIVAALPMQMMSYELARSLGRNIDRPRNLAKSVTVE